MNDLEQSLGQLKRVEPNADWAVRTKLNLMNRIELQQDEVVVRTWFKRAEEITPRLSFLQESRLRLMNYAHKKQQYSRSFFGDLRRLFASILVMVLAVATTLFFDEGQTTVVANNITRLEVLTGEVMMQDQLTWERVTGWRELKKGDLIRTGSAVDAVMHFNENQLRLGPNTVLLVSELDAVGETRFNLSQGTAWLQVPSAKAESGFVELQTATSSVLTPNASVLVKAEPLGGSTTVEVFSGVARVSHSNPATLEPKVDVMSANEELIVYAKEASKGVLPFDAQGSEKTPWILQNIQRDKLHENRLREVELQGLKRSLLRE